MTGVGCETCRTMTVPNACFTVCGICGRDLRPTEATAEARYKAALERILGIDSVHRSMFSQCSVANDMADIARDALGVKS